MKTKAFTLIELLAVIVILSIIAIITVPVITSSITNSKDNLYNRQVDMITNAAERYVNDNAMTFTGTEIAVSELKSEGYLKNETIKNPKNGSAMNGCVKISVSGKKYTYTYNESC